MWAIRFCLLLQFFNSFEVILVLTFSDNQLLKNLNLPCFVCEQSQFIFWQKRGKKGRKEGRRKKKKERKEESKEWQQNRFCNGQLKQEIQFCPSNYASVCWVLVWCTYQFSGRLFNWVTNGRIWHSSYESLASLCTGISCPIIIR